jgi:hyperosmotically inducible periplasmic protein
MTIEASPRAASLARGIRSAEREKEKVTSPSFVRHAWRTGPAIVALCGMLACATGPPKTDAQRQADKETADRVQSALDADRLLYAKHITVRADNGVVRLSGFVWDPPDLDEAERIAEGVQGVSKVVNDLELQRNGIDDSGVVR